MPENSNVSNSNTFSQAQNYRPSLNHSFDVALATILKSVDQAILVHHFQYWINHNKALKRNFKEGRTWTYQTREEIAAHFPYWTTDQVRRYTDILVEKEILVKGNFNKSPMDKTIWYAFKNEEMFTNGNFAKWTGENASSIGESAKAIPHTIPHSIPKDIVCCSEPPVAASPPSNDLPSFVQKLNLGRQIIECRLEEVFRVAVVDQKNWSGDEIRYAWKALCETEAAITDWIQFIDGTIKKYRQKKKSANIANSKKQGDTTCEKMTQPEQSKPSYLAPGSPELPLAKYMRSLMPKEK